MGTLTDEKPWDPYETSQKRDFIYRPNATTEDLRHATSQAYRNSYSLSGPVGSTAYTEDFCWKLTSKPECIRTGSASGQRRNNPHPSESFMVWRLPKSSIRSSADRRALPIEEEIQKALTAQYCSTYRTDFLGIPQGFYHIHNTEGRLAPSHSRHQGPQMFTDTEMRHSYRQREQIPEMQGNKTRYGSNCNPFVPSGLQSNICNQRVKRLDMTTTYDMFFGKKTSDVTSVLESLQPQSLQQLCRTLPERGKELAHAHLSRAAHVNHGEKLKTLPPIPHTYHSGYQVNEQQVKVE